MFTSPLTPLIIIDGIARLSTVVARYNGAVLKSACYLRITQQCQQTIL